MDAGGDNHYGVPNQRTIGWFICCYAQIGWNRQVGDAKFQESVPSHQGAYAKHPEEHSEEIQRGRRATGARIYVRCGHIHVAAGCRCGSSMSRGWARGWTLGHSKGHADPALGRCCPRRPFDLSKLLSSCDLEYQRATEELSSLHVSSQALRYVHASPFSDKSFSFSIYTLATFTTEP